MNVPHQIDRSRLRVIEAVATEAAGASRAASDHLQRLNEKRERLRIAIAEIENADRRIPEIERKLPVLHADLDELKQQIEDAKIDCDLARSRRSVSAGLLQSCREFLEEV